LATKHLQIAFPAPLDFPTTPWRPSTDERRGIRIVAVAFCMPQNYAEGGISGSVSVAIPFFLLFCSLFMLQNGGILRLMDSGGAEAKSNWN